MHLEADARLGTSHTGHTAAGAGEGSGLVPVLLLGPVDDGGQVHQEPVVHHGLDPDGPQHLVHDAAVRDGILARAHDQAHHPVDHGDQLEHLGIVVGDLVEALQVGVVDRGPLLGADVDALDGLALHLCDHPSTLLVGLGHLGDVTVEGRLSLTHLHEDGLCGVLHVPVLHVERVEHLAEQLVALLVEVLTELVDLLADHVPDLLVGLITTPVDPVDLRRTLEVLGTDPATLAEELGVDVDAVDVEHLQQALTVLGEHLTDLDATTLGERVDDLLHDGNDLRQVLGLGGSRDHDRVDDGTNVTQLTGQHLRDHRADDLRTVHLGVEHFVEVAHARDAHLTVPHQLECGLGDHTRNGGERRHLAGDAGVGGEGITLVEGEHRELPPTHGDTTHDDLALAPDGTEDEHEVVIQVSSTSVEAEELDVVLVVDDPHITMADRADLTTLHVHTVTDEVGRGLGDDGTAPGAGQRVLRPVALEVVPLVHETRAHHGDERGREPVVTATGVEVLSHVGQVGEVLVDLVGALQLGVQGLLGPVLHETAGLTGGDVTLALSQGVGQELDVEILVAQDLTQHDVRLDVGLRVRVRTEQVECDRHHVIRSPELGLDVRIVEDDAGISNSHVLVRGDVAQDLQHATTGSSAEAQSFHTSEDGLVQTGSLQHLQHEAVADGSRTVQQGVDVVLVGELVLLAGELIAVDLDDVHLLLGELDDDVTVAEQPCQTLGAERTDLHVQVHGLQQLVPARCVGVLRLEDGDLGALLPPEDGVRGVDQVDDLGQIFRAAQVEVDVPDLSIRDNGLDQVALAEELTLDHDVGIHNFLLGCGQMSGIALYTS